MFKKQPYPDRRALLEDTRGWQLLDVINWLVTDGRRCTDLTAFTKVFCERVREAGLPLSRVRIVFRTLHPQVFVSGCTWRHGQGVALYTRRHGIEQSVAFAGSPIEYVLTRVQSFRRRLTDLDSARDDSVLFEIAAEGGTDYLATPALFSNDQIGALLIAVTDVPSGFDDTDIAKLDALTDFLAPVLEVFATRHTARALLDTYVGPRTGDRVLRGLIKRGDSETIHSALWFSDLRDFTQFTESLPLPELLAMLNEYFELVAAAVTARGGEILRFIGDAMLIVFPEAHQLSKAEACKAALDAAQDAFNSLAAVNHQRLRRQLPLIEFGVGLHVGDVIYGNVGAPDRLDFTVMGAAVNRTARLESLTKTLNVSLLMSREFAEYVDRPVRSMGSHAMKGVPEPQEVVTLVDT